MYFFFFQAEDGIRDLVRSRGLGDVYKRQSLAFAALGDLALHEFHEADVSDGTETRSEGVIDLSLIHI